MMKFFTYKTCESQHFIAKTREIQYLWTLQWLPISYTVANCT